MPGVPPVSRGAACGGVRQAPAQSARLIVSWIRVTLPVPARRALTVTLSPRVIEADARMLPTNTESLPNVALLPTCQKTWHGWAPLMKLTWLADAVVSVEPIWKMKTPSDRPCPSRVSVPVSAAEESYLYTPADSV